MVCGKCVGQFVLQVNKVSLSHCQALGGSFQVLSNHNNWSRRLAGGNKGTSVCRWQERLGEILLSSALHSNHCHAVILSNTGHYCAVYVCVGYVWITCKCAFSYVYGWSMSVWVCAREDSIHAFLPAYSHTDMQVIIRYCTPVVFFPHSPLRRLYPWMRGLFGFSSGFPLCTVTPVLLAVSWPGHTTVFFHLSLTEEMISDWERWGRNDKLIHPTSEPSLGAHCKPFWFQYTQAVAKILFPLPSTTVQRVLINVCGCFSEIFNNWYWSIIKLAPFMWVRICKYTFCQQFNPLWYYAIYSKGIASPMVIIMY